LVAFEEATKRPSAEIWEIGSPESAEPMFCFSPFAASARLTRTVSLVPTASATPPPPTALSRLAGVAIGFSRAVDELVNLCRGCGITRALLGPARAVGSNSSAIARLLQEEIPLGGGFLSMPKKGLELLTRGL
jgi:hypothetical protein